VDSSISSYGPVMVQFMSSLTQIMAHIYNTVLVFPLRTNIW